VKPGGDTQISIVESWESSVCPDVRLLQDIVHVVTNEPEGKPSQRGIVVPDQRPEGGSVAPHRPLDDPWIHAGWVLGGCHLIDHTPLERSEPGDFFTNPNGMKRDGATASAWYTRGMWPITTPPGLPNPGSRYAARALRNRA
jgi:hypothetical protein